MMQFRKHWLQFSSVQNVPSFHSTSKNVQIKRTNVQFCLLIFIGLELDHFSKGKDTVLGWLSKKC
jgi:hypothetical protein